MTGVQMLSAPACDLGESPHWDATTHTLSWVDLHVGLLYRHSPDGTRSYTFEAPLSAARPAPQHPHGVVLVQGNRVGVVEDPERDLSVTWRGTVPLGGALRCNDAQIDARGRLWVGTMSLDRPQSAALFVLQPNLDQPTVVCSGLTLANGIGWSPSGDEVYVVDTTTSTVRGAYLDDDGLPASDFTTVLDLSETEGAPDGLAVDSEGGIWLAMFGAGNVSRFERSGALTQLITLPVRHPTSLVFAGAGLDELVVTTARRTPRVSDTSPNAGRLFKVRPGTRGVGGSA